MEICGVPPEMDLFSSTPKMLYLMGEDGLVNLRTVAGNDYAPDGCIMSAVVKFQK